MKRAKTRTKLAYILLAILSVVFAFIVGVTYCATSFNLQVGSNSYATNTYLAMQNYTIINDSLTSPIPYGTGAHNSEVVLQYSYSYSVDVRIKYSLSWSNGLSTENVILNYANRDNFMVDSEYIFVRDSITGTGQLTIFTGVDFTLDDDFDYVGASLTINIDEVRVYKVGSSSYNSSHPLVSGINTTTYPSAQAWLKYKARDSSNSNAFVIVYNHLYEGNGVSHPIDVGAYYRVDGNYRWLGGMKSYAGVGVYVVTGSSPITLSATVRARWYAGSETGQVFDNNLLLHYASGWNAVSSLSDEIFPTYNYSTYIPAYSTAYIEIVDSLEITTRGSNADRTAYRGASAVIYSIGLNGGFTSVGEAEISSGEIASAGFSASSGYSQPNYEIVNSTLYKPLLYVYNNYGTSAAAQTFELNISIVNNTSTALQISNVSYTLHYYIGNGSNSTNVANSFAGTDWYRATGSSTSAITSITSAGFTYVPPYSSITLTTSVQIGANFQSNIVATNYGSFDAYTYVVPNVTFASSSTVKAEVEFGMSGTTGVFYLKNKTDSILTVSATTLQLREITYEFTQLTSSIDSSVLNNWSSIYWQYYVRSGSNFIRNTNSSRPSTSNLSSYYSMSVVSDPVTLSGTNFTTYNGFTNGSSNMSLTLKPGESLKIAEIRGLTNSRYVRYELTYQNSTQPSTTARASTNNTIDVVNEDSNNAYIINNSSSSYFVRYNGTSSTSTDIRLSGGYYYYIGIVRPGQIVKIPLINASSTRIVLQNIVAPDTYVDGASGTLSSWTTDSTILNAFRTYFNGSGS